MKRLDLTGYRKGELTVIGYSHSHVQPSGQKRAVWDVTCSCGVKKKMSTSTLRHDRTISCGHIFRDIRKTARLLPNNQAEKNYLFLSYKHSAKNRDIEFNISKEEFNKLIGKDCYYCGAKPSNIRKARGELGKDLIYNGIDRLDNSKSYERDNVVSCCQKCNFMKRDMSFSEFIKHTKEIVKYMEGKFNATT